MKEVRAIQAMGVEIVLLLAEMDAGRFDAAFLAIGAHLGKRIDIPARDASRMVTPVSLDAAAEEMSYCCRRTEMVPLPRSAVIWLVWMLAEACGSGSAVLEMSGYAIGDPISPGNTCEVNDLRAAFRQSDGAAAALFKQILPADFVRARAGGTN